MDYKLTQGNSRQDYLCENAIGLLQPFGKQRKGQVLLFDLIDGNDKVYLGDNDITPSLFRMGNDGHKDYNGGGGRNEFLFDSDCSQNLRGRFYGGNGIDAIIVGDSCSKRNDLTVDFLQGKIYSKNRKDARMTLDMIFNRIEEFVGRLDNPDVVEIACSTRQVNGRGGLPYRPDIVDISKSSCSHNVTILASNFTLITSHATNGNIVIPVKGPSVGIQLLLDIYPRENLKTNVIFMDAGASHVTAWKVQSLENHFNVTLQLSLESILLGFNLFQGATDGLLYFNEQPAQSPMSMLHFSFHRSVTAINALFYHTLPSVAGTLIRYGCGVIKNIFDITGNGWLVIGGQLDDEFILHASYVNRIEGGLGNDTLSFHPNFKHSIEVNLNSEKFKSIERVIGVEGVPLTVYTSCDTQLVASQGGSQSVADKIHIAKTPCGNRNLQVLAAGNTKVVYETIKNGYANDDNVLIVATGNSQSELKFHLEVTSTEPSNLQVGITVSHLNWEFVKATIKPELQSISIHFSEVSKTSENGWIKLDLKHDHVSNAPFLRSPLIQVAIESSSELPGKLIFDVKSGNPKMLYYVGELSDHDANTLHGFTGIENIFQLQNTLKDMSIFGGNKSDIFLLSTNKSNIGTFSVHGGNGSDNTLMLGNDETTNVSAFVVNLVKNEVGYIGAPSASVGRVNNIQHVIGRENCPDIIYPSCDAKSVNGKGGKDEPNHWDKIIIKSDVCKFDLTTAIPPFTTVINTAKSGRFVYDVEDLTTSNLELTVTNQNIHLIKLEFHPWNFIQNISFDKVTQEMKWILQNGVSVREQAFKMSKSSEQEIYRNPVFEFHPSGSTVSSDILVSADGITMATFTVSGLRNLDYVKGIPVHINRFIINITSELGKSGGIIKGCEDSIICKANQFWIHGIHLGLDTLDGGSCNNGECKNYLHFSEIFQENNLTIDLDIYTGSIESNDGKQIISKLRNIHELHGHRGMTALVTCNTTQVSNVEKVIVRTALCPFQLILGLDEYTNVLFDDFESDKNQNNDLLLNSTIYYRFTKPMSFDPEGEYEVLSVHNHNYYFPFTLPTLESFSFDLEEHRLQYTIQEIQYSHYMLLPPTDTEQFYTQPNMVTEDGYRIQVARDGSLWATLGNTDVEINANLTPELQDTANKLGITMVLHTKTNFFFVGHATKKDDRNFLQTAAKVTNHLAGGGADDTIYEIVFLDKDIFIYTGYDVNSFDESDKYNNGKGVKQTIDMTDVIVPIRAESGTKYVPSVKAVQNNLVISANGYTDRYPGSVIIVNGALPWIAKRIQLLLGNSLMDLVIEDQLNRNSTSPQFVELTNRTKRSADTFIKADNKWTIKPRPIVVPDSIAIFSISPEDLEDGQTVQLATQGLLNRNDTVGQESNNNVNFELAKNGLDLYMTNIGTTGRYENPKTIIISEYFDVDYNDNVYDLTVSNKPANVTVYLGYLHVFLNLSQVTSLSHGTSDQTKETNNNIKMKTWKQILHDTESTLLKDMPTISRSFHCEECLPWWKQKSKIITMMLSLLIGTAFIMMALLYKRNQSRGKYQIAESQLKYKVEFHAQKPDVYNEKPACEDLIGDGAS